MAAHPQWPALPKALAAADEQIKKWQGGHRWHPHQLRHTAATAFRREGDFEGAKILLGHKSDSMTQHYAERDNRKADEMIARLG